jgi:hypothetical protein
MKELGIRPCGEATVLGGFSSGGAAFALVADLLLEALKVGLDKGAASQDDSL